MTLKGWLMTAAIAALVIAGLYSGVTNGVEPHLVPCTKYTLICRP